MASLDIKYFTPQEFFKTNDKNQFPSLSAKETWQVLKNACTLIAYLDEIRRIFGKAIYINSGFRSSQHNSDVGGVSNSKHLVGLAVDIRADQLSSLRDCVLAYCGLSATPGVREGKYIYYKNNNSKFKVLVYSSFIHLQLNA